MNELLKAGQEIEAFCQEQDWRFCFIGALAVQRWGEPRLTQDIDLTIITGFGAEARYVSRLLEHFDPRMEDARDFALRNRVLLLKTRGEVPIDVSMGAMPIEERVVQRATRFEFAKGIELTTCSAEDLVILKAFASRGKDWLDIDGILIRQGSSLDWPLILRELEPLVELKEEPEILEKLHRLRKRS